MPRLIPLAHAAALILAVAGAHAATPGDRTIVYATGSGGPDVRPTEIYVRSATGEVRRLTNTAAYEGFPSWSPDKTRIAFVRSVRNDSDIYIMNADGTGVRRLAGSRRGAQDLYPAWSPDGRSIAFASNRFGEADIFVMRADGTGLRRLTRTARWVDDTQPRFSPSGKYIVFTSNRVAFSNYEVFRIRASDGRGAKRLTFWGSGGDAAPGDDLMPEYSPDGKRIAFVSDRGGAYAVWTMRADGRELRRVARNARLNVAFPRYSPDGAALVYTTFKFDDVADDFRLWTVPAPGGTATQIGAGSEADW